MVEHRIPNPGVAGSSPPVPATFKINKHFQLMKLMGSIYCKCKEEIDDEKRVKKCKTRVSESYLPN